MIFDLKKVLQDGAADKIASHFDMSDEKVSSIIDTVANAVTSKQSNMDSKIVSDLQSKNDLSENIAVQIKNMVLPLIMEAISNNAGDKLSGLMGKFNI